MSTNHVYNDCIPLVPSGTTVEITCDQSLENLLEVATPNKVKIKVDGPQLKLTPADIAGVYPAPGSDDSPDEFLPHIALKRRTLPWERTGPAAGAPWLALLVVKESDFKSGARSTSPAATLTALTLKDLKTKDLTTYNRLHGNLPTGLKLPDSTELQVTFISNGLLKKILPLKTELKWLCHMKRKTENGTIDDAAIVIANRLPEAGPANTPPDLHTAMLVSLELRSDAYTRPAKGSTALVVLHHWTFTPSKGGDFEQVMQAISYRPNGGVQRFGNLPKPPPQGTPAPLSGGFDAKLSDTGYLLEEIPHTQPGLIDYRGPLRPFPTPKRSNGFAIRPAPEEFAGGNDDTPVDYSHAAAFEIGRLLALADPTVLEQMRDIHAVMNVDPPVLVNQLPVKLQMPDWVVDPAWAEDPWAFGAESILKDEAALLGNVEADFTGIAEQAAAWKDLVLQDLAQLPAAELPTPVQLDLGTVTGDLLAQKFGDVANAAMT